MSRTLAAILGGAAGAVALVGVVIVIIWLCLFHNRSVSRTSDTGSSDPSVQGDPFVIMLTFRSITHRSWINFNITKSLYIFLTTAVGRATGYEMTVREARRFVMEELSLATKNFSESLIGEGKFGEVYKGLLHDGILVAIKKRPGAPSQDFVDEVIMIINYNFWNVKDRIFLSFSPCFVLPLLWGGEVEI